MMKNFMPPKHSKDQETLGERLRKRREALGFTLKDVADEIQTAQKHVTALEEDSYDVFPAKVYALGFFKKILNLFGTENKEDWIKEFNTEWEIRMFRKDKTIAPLPENRGDGPYLTPARFGLLIGGMGLLIFLLFLVSQLQNFVGIPKLKVEEPGNQALLEVPMVRVRGSTEKEGRLTVNGRELRVDERGNFDETLELAAGLNALEFQTENRFGKVQKEVRYVIVK
ncbi:MAG: helix-turn-helix domain-containing protein [Candidatus Sungiibacteriota bacterium]|uniref:Helix-turn-helix domain-containing protein n=1 Tax=Candidatus Sungiibacteriota bacterium TaxID=2750080 RepID=A0A7T5RJJ3_9BACT|nr:MAG: helix-turn-helix domain-containing protein [Candidatus Sungbacteria bacterium]